MKSSHALILAVLLGGLGALLNYLYLCNKVKDIGNKVDFVGIGNEDEGDPPVEVKPGERLLRKHVVAVSIPQAQVDILDKFAFRYKDVETVINKPVSRLLVEGSLLLEDDLKTPPPELKLGENELAWPIPVDTRAFVPSLIRPGDEVWFLGAATPVAVPTPAVEEPIPESGSNGSEAVSAAGPSVTPGSSRIIGPFTVLALGNRLGSAEVMRAAKIRQVQENVMLVKVTMKGGSLESPANELLGLLEATGSRPLGYFWRPRREEAK